MSWHSVGGCGHEGPGGGVCLNAVGDERRRQVLTIERRELAMETLGMNLTESKALLAGVQDFVVAHWARGRS